MCIVSSLIHSNSSIINRIEGTSLSAQFSAAKNQGFIFFPLLPPLFEVHLGAVMTHKKFVSLWRENLAELTWVNVAQVAVTTGHV